MNEKFCNHSGKKCYTSEDASNVLRKARGRGRHKHSPTGKIPKRKYLCEFCGMYHLTSQSVFYYERKNKYTLRW